MENGQVIEILPDNSVKICITRTEACAKCGACLSSGKDMTIIAYNPDGARMSERVSLSLGSKYFLRASLILYGMPLIALLMGTAAGYYGAVKLRLSQFSPVAGLLSGVVFTMAAYLFIKAFDKKIRKSDYMPTAHKI